MGARGPKPKPAALKVLADARPDRIGPATLAATAAAGIPAPPGFLGREALEEWHRIAPQLAAAGVLTEGDGPALALYCSAFARRLAAQREVDAIGLLTETAAGGYKANPAVAMVAQAERDMARILAEFGATPASRSRVAAPEKPSEESELERFLNMRA